MNLTQRREHRTVGVQDDADGQAMPDLSQVEEVGFTDLMEGGWIPSTSRIRSWEVWGKAVPR